MIAGGNYAWIIAELALHENREYVESVEKDYQHGINQKKSGSGANSWFASAPKILSEVLNLRRQSAH